MTVDAELRRGSIPELEDEQEIDFGRYWRAIATRWWLVAAGVAAGIVIGLLLALGGNTVYNAEAIAYLGSPLAPGAGGQVSSPPTQLAIAEEVALSEATARQVAAATGLRRRQIRGHVLVRPVAGVTNAKVGTPAPILAITVKGTAPRKTAEVANVLARIVTARSSAYVSEKIATLKEHLVYDAQQIGVVKQRRDRALRQLNFALESKTLDPAARLISIQNFSSIVNSSESRLSSLEQDRFGVRQTLKLAQEVEAGKVVTKAIAVPSKARSRRSSTLVGAIIGLLLGALAAILYEPVAARLQRRPGH